MGRLVAGLLDLARLESGQVVLEPVPVDLGTAIERVRARFEPLAAEQGVELRVASASGLEAMADDDRLAQVLGNLVDNALRHTPRGGVVELAGRRQGRGIVAVSVRDTGIGIGGDRLEQLTGHPGVGLPEGQGDGLGLGLAIVREIVAALGGTIAIESREGQGTTVTVTLPAAP
jgi:two-component system sensor histidine kinase ResE